MKSKSTILYFFNGILLYLLLVIYPSCALVIPHSYSDISSLMNISAYFLHQWLIGHVRKAILHGSVFIRGK